MSLKDFSSFSGLVHFQYAGQLYHIRWNDDIMLSLFGGYNLRRCVWVPS